MLVYRKKHTEDLVVNFALYQVKIRGYLTRSGADQDMLSSVTIIRQIISKVGVVMRYSVSLLVNKQHSYNLINSVLITTPVIDAHQQ